ncbi:MAG TPA: hypothetical protein PLK37_03505 [Terricaulis sp.]|nr:hypothetical protein [Terricaulis sp.]
MSFHGTSAALAALFLAACASTAPPAEVSQGAVSAIIVAEAEAPAPGTPEFHGASIGRDALRSRLHD